MGVSRSSKRALSQRLPPLSQRLPREFFQRDPVSCARDLVGCTLLWEECESVVVETEAYSAVNDEACHTWSRPSARRFVEEHSAGSAYVYFNYGVHWMLNVLVKDGNEDGFVLLRALQPVRGVELMRVRRSKAGVTNSNAWLCSGPGKLAKALGVTGNDHGRDFCEGEIGFFPRTTEVKIISDARVGISKAQHLQWRFLLAGSDCWSVKPKRPK